MTELLMDLLVKLDSLVLIQSLNCTINTAPWLAGDMESEWAVFKGSMAEIPLLMGVVTMRSSLPVVVVTKEPACGPQQQGGLKLKKGS